MSLGNIDHSVRWSEKLQSARLVGLLPSHPGSFPLNRSKITNTGIESHESTEPYREWSRGNMHIMLHAILSPLYEAMRNGIELKCSDGEIRLCFPVLSIYMADCEEQMLLGNLWKWSCPKCLAPRNALEKHRNLNRDIRNDGPQTWCAQTRTDSDARRLRQQYRDGEVTIEDLKRHSYHPTDTFCVNLPGAGDGGILSALSPDLLHQTSKCFMDYIMVKFLIPLMEAQWTGTKKPSGKGRYAKKHLYRELDRRFMYIPAHRHLTRFHNGVFSQNHGWTMKEYKNMMKIIMGVLAGICHLDGIDLLREYLHIHRLANYHVHTAQSLELLDSAIHSFWRILKAPGRQFVVRKILGPDVENWASLRLHWMTHYAQSVRDKGPLPAYSTDRTEPLHKQLKELYRKTNKNTQTKDLQILKGESRICAFKIRKYEIETALRNPMDLWDEDTDESDESDEEENDDAEGGNNKGHDTSSERGVPSVQQHHVHRMATKQRPGFPRSLESASELLDLPDLVSAMRTFIAISEAAAGGNGVKGLAAGIERMSISVYNSAVVSFPAKAVWGAEISGSFANDWTPKVQRDRITAGPSGGLRRDCVIVDVQDRPSRSSRRNAMAGRQVARVHILLKLLPPRGQKPIPNFEAGLAYIQWFSTMGEPDAHTGMYSVRATQRFEVIQIDRIEQSVHVLPKFGKTLETPAVQVGLRGPEVFEHYKEFYLNPYIDEHNYNSIY
jgi:Plavaka transposase